ncbi:MAG TPA: DNA-directed RNA polymerase subunit beta [Candidatus Binatus sp.]|uniref:DNA-directed RNA polymerase subunit beta n=1 Tax=Candidatus Binatus sp. TaxID=2811406 RepID=UPI002B4A07F7|nr:DNA-directed RNA polymerase subunit beta [Candidatus Binatus sp.]HKN11927.1 DNA-directed RNA polymerase subunit beta [Candidatus Binatus sp.]
MAQVHVTSNLRIRRSFGKIKKIIEIPNLIEIQKRSYDDFLQVGVSTEDRADVGLQAVFKSVFPIKDFNETASLEFVSYELGTPKYDVEECHQRGMTYAAPLKVKIQLVIWDVENGRRSIKNVKEQEVYFGEIPLMTGNGTFMVNGTERVIVSQLHRSPGVFFEHDKGRTHSTGKLLYSARIIPYRGSWIDFEFDPRDVLYVRIDRRRKFPATVLLRALGMTTEDLLNYYYRKDVITLDPKQYTKQFVADHLMGSRVGRDVKDPKSGEVIAREGRKFNKAIVRAMEQAKISEVPIALDEIVGKVSAHDIVDSTTGEVLIGTNEEITEDTLEKLKAHGVKKIEVLFTEDAPGGGPLRLTLAQDKLGTPEEAVIEIYRRLRPGDPPTQETATTFFNNLFFNAERYDLSKVGRLKLNHKLKIDVPLEQGTLRREDILEVVRYLMDLKNGNGQVDDIDHLGNRRVRAVGELVENQFRIGLVRMERAIKERMSLQDIETLMPQELVNYKPASAVIKEFFGSSQLSQFMDQTNPLSEIAHKRRLSALGPGGLTRERAGFEVRDVHPTHYGRVCPIETPEGPNIGLIAALSTYARVNEYGFIETPYREVENNRVTERILYLSALDEEDKVIAQANAKLDAHGRFTDDIVSARIGGESTMVRAEDVQYMDVSPNQLVSVAASLIPFLENDDANRALMGSNMQRQAVPLLKPDAPLVGTGLEGTVGRDSGVTVVGKRDGIVESVDAERIVVRADKQTKDLRDAGVDIYNLIKYQRSNQNTCINQRPIVVKGERVKSGDVLADGPSTDMGELALGRNVLVAFMPWGGYNFEDSILISERVVKEDLFTSVHIEEFECIARDTKLGPEEITRDIPNVGEEALKDLDASGIIRIGAEVRPQDILVGKITPKGETQLSPEEKLLRAIFGEKAGEVRDTSLRVPPGVEGTVIDGRVFSRRGVSKDERTQEIEVLEAERLKTDEAEEVRIIRQETLRKLKKSLVGKKLAGRVMSDERKELLKKGDTISAEELEELPPTLWGQVRVENESAQEEAENAIAAMNANVEAVQSHYGAKVERLKAGDELAPGVIKMIKVFVAIKRRLQVGDKMAGRHGNKGVLSRILPEEDMPCLADGTPVDIVLNPLGVPSRMNVGQILETHLGWAARELGHKIEEDLRNGVSAAQLKRRLKEIYPEKESHKFIDELAEPDIYKLAAKALAGVHVASPVFDGAREEEIFQLLKRADLPETGQAQLHDGRTGLPFEQPVTVGVMYMMKLHHLVEDKIHARSTGPYSLVTQQPLGGKAQFGGQRLGEMEVWALEAYGAAYTLQEMLTVKSDDVAGRTRMYEAIVKGENTLEPGLPESFNVMVKELQSLCLNMELLEQPQRA